MRFDEVIRSCEFIKNEDEPCVYKKISGGVITFVVLYVDDILLIGNDVGMLSLVKAWLSKNLSTKDLGEATYVLGIRIYRDRLKKLLGLSQSMYIAPFSKGLVCRTPRKISYRSDMEFKLLETRNYAS